MINPTDFHRMWISVPGALRDALNEGNVLTCSHEQVQFLLGHAEQLAQAFEILQEMNDPRPTFLLLLDDQHRAALAAEETVSVPVLDVDQSVAGQINLIGAEGDTLRTEHGVRKIDSIPLSDLSAGDFFAISDRTEPWREWVVYWAGTVDGDKVEAQRLVEPLRLVPVNSPWVTFRGANQVVFRIVERDGLQEIIDKKVAAAG